MMKKQLAYILGRQQIFLDLDEEMDEYDDLVEIISNAHYNNNFLALAREVSQWRARWRVTCLLCRHMEDYNTVMHIILWRVRVCFIACIDVVDIELGRYIGMEL